MVRGAHRPRAPLAARSRTYPLRRPRDPHSPTAPSPITVTVVRGPILALTAAWWPAGNTSDRVSSDGGTPSADGLNLLASWAATLEAAGSAPGQPGQAR